MLFVFAFLNNSHAADDLLYRSCLKVRLFKLFTPSFRDSPVNMPSFRLHIMSYLICPRSHTSNGWFGWRGSFCRHAMQTFSAMFPERFVPKSLVFRAHTAGSCCVHDPRLVILFLLVSPHRFLIDIISTLQIYFPASDR